MLEAHIRWLVQPDIDKLLEIEDSVPHPWIAEDLCNFLHQRNSIGMVIEREDQIVGYMAYDLCSRHLELLRLVVHPAFRRQGLGRHLLAKLANKLSSHRRTSIILNVSEWDTPTHLWLKACGFQAIRIVPGRDEDLYRFVYRLPGATPVTIPVGEMVWL